jgi:CRP-like cAMP-binding protein
MENKLLLLIRNIVSLPAAEENKLLDICSTATIKKGESYIQAGQVPKKFAFIYEGLFRYLYRDAKGNEYTKNFISENNFILAYSAMIQQTPSKMYIEALENSVVYEIDYSDWLTLKNNHPGWNIFLIALLEKAFMIKENRERELLLLDAEKRYEIFKKEFPTLESRVKQHLIASYLGISPVSLSRIKNRTS